MMHLAADCGCDDYDCDADTSPQHATTATFADHLAVPDQRSVDWRQAGTRLSDMLQKASTAYHVYQATTSHAAAASSSSPFASGGVGGGGGAPSPHSPSRAAPPRAALQRWGWFRGDLVARRKPEPPSLLFPDAWWGGGAEGEASELAAAVDQATTPVERGRGSSSSSNSSSGSLLRVPPPEGLSTLARIAASNCVDLAAAPVLEVVRHCWRWQIPFLDPAFPPCTGGGGGGDYGEGGEGEDGCEAAAWVRAVPASSVCSFSSPDLAAPATLADVRRVSAAGEGGACAPGVPGWLPACAAAMLHAGKRLPAVRRLEAGAVQARLCGTGCWAPVVTDPYVPLCGDGGGGGGDHPDEARAWMLLVAKCFAKVAGGYRALAVVEGAASTPGEVLEGFTGAPYSVLTWPPPGDEERAALEALLARGCPAVATLASGGEGRGGNVHAALLGHREFLGRSVALLAAVPPAPSGGGERRQPWEGAAGFANPPGCRWTSSEGIRSVAVCHTAAAEDTVRVRVALKDGAPVQIVEARGRETAVAAPVAGRGDQGMAGEEAEAEEEKDADTCGAPVEVMASVLHPVHPVALLALCEAAERPGEWRVEASSVEEDGAAAAEAATRRVHFSIPPGSRCVVVCRPLTEDGDQEVWVSLAAARPLVARALLPTRHGVLLPLGFFGERHPRAGKVFRGVPPDSLDVSYCPVTQVEMQWDGACSTDVPAGRRGA